MIVVNCPFFSDWKPRMIHIDFLQVFNRRSHLTPKCGEPGGLNVHLIPSFEAFSSTWVPFRAANYIKSFRAAPTKFVPLSNKNGFWITSFGQKKMNRIRAALCIQCWHNFEVNCSGVKTGEQTSPLLLCFPEVFPLKCSKVVHTKIAEKLNHSFQPTCFQILHLMIHCSCQLVALNKFTLHR